MIFPRRKNAISWSKGLNSFVIHILLSNYFKDVCHCYTIALLKFQGCVSVLHYVPTISRMYFIETLLPNYIAQGCISLKHYSTATYFKDVGIVTLLRNCFKDMCNCNTIDLTISRIRFIITQLPNYIFQGCWHCNTITQLFQGYV